MTEKELCRNEIFDATPFFVRFSGSRVVRYLSRKVSPTTGT